MRRLSGTFREPGVEGPVRLGAVELVGEGVDEGTILSRISQHLWNSERLVPIMRSMVPLSLGAWREHPDGDAPCLASAFELGQELRPAIDLDGFDGERHLAGEHFGEIRGVAGCGPLS